MEQLQEIYNSLDVTKQQQFDNICSPDNYIKIENNDGHTIISFSKVKSTDCVKVKHPMAVLHACDIIFHTPNDQTIETIKEIIKHIDLQCTDPNTIDIETEASEQLLKELNELETDDKVIIIKYITRIEDAVATHTDNLEKNKPLYDYVSMIIENDNFDDNEKIEYEKNELYEMLIVEKSSSELLQLFYDLNLKTFKNMSLSLKLTTFHEELIANVKDKAKNKAIKEKPETDAVSKMRRYLQIFRKIIEDIKEEMYDHHCLQLLSKLNDDFFKNKLEEETICQLYNEMFDMTDIMCNKFITYLNTTVINIVNRDQIFVNCTDIMSEFVTVFENFDKDKKEVLDKIKTSADNVDDKTRDKFTHIVKQMETALKHMNYFNKKKDEILKIINENSKEQKIELI